MTPTSHPDRICETLKLTLNAHSETAAEPAEESKTGTQLGHSIDDLVTQVREFLTLSRNDGNKLYEVLAVSTTFMGAPLPLGLTASSLLTNGSDVYVTVRITIDSSKHIAPLSSVPIAASKLMGNAKKPAVFTESTDKMRKFRTITKYSYAESGDKWIKVLLSDLTGLKDHPADKVKVEFPSNRSFSVVVTDWKGENLQFTVPRLQCRILPQACTFGHKSSGLQINLRKKNTSDNWWSLFKSKAIGERESDDDEEVKK